VWRDDWSETTLRSMSLWRRPNWVLRKLSGFDEATTRARTLTELDIEP
jgi:hypothetical protein